METKQWTKCFVSGIVTTCDPGCNREYSYPRTILREEMKIGMNLCSHKEPLPKIMVESIADDHIIVHCSGKSHRIDAGTNFCTPRKPLDYAYSEAIISLK